MLDAVCKLGMLGLRMRLNADLFVDPFIHELASFGKPTIATEGFTATTATKKISGAGGGA
ncbi:hypothetical protein O9K51_00945 [Purpureocillium lavendulum]|uniref:Uncharacterized protein n=1 Tax=Purpureocillium lavendulum TaxID=1247861 RepID=A0AB34G3Y9_9HYPO|nr:hypothetical protein O9K51_00945 [Purpureocillium lavendulum]